MPNEQFSEAPRSHLKDSPNAEAEMFEAIGRFVVSFSRLQDHLEIAISLMVDGPSSDGAARILLNGERGPEAGRTITVYRHLVRAAIARRDSDTRDFAGIIELLCNEVHALIKYRNDVMHGAWWVGSTTNDVSDFSSSTVMRAKAGGATERRAIDAEALLLKAERCELLALVGFQAVVSLISPEIAAGASIRDVTIVDGQIRLDRYDARTKARGPFADHASR